MRTCTYELRSSPDASRIKIGLSALCRRDYVNIGSCRYTLLYRNPVYGVENNNCFGSVYAVHCRGSFRLIYALMQR